MTKDIIHAIVIKNHEIVEHLGERSIGTLMVICMKELRGKISGEECNVLLNNEIKNYLEGKQ